jgi:LuxR family maltose regulon positive regulatory protein
LLDGPGIALAESDLAVLCQRTEGWVAGLRLASISLAGHGEPGRFVAEFCGSERTVADYLLVEILDRQPDHVRNVLLLTSVPERVSGPLADFMTGGSGSVGILQRLEEENAFVVSLDAERSRFRYHHLFADLLRLQLRRTEPDRLTKLHQAAAAWFAGHGYVVGAVRHAQAAGEWRQAALLLADHMVSLILDGQGETMRALLGDFPADVVSGNAELAPVFAADQLNRGSLDNAAAYMDLAERRASTVPDDRRGRFERTVVNGRLSLARRRGHFAAVLDRAEAIPLLEPRTSRDIGLWNDLQGVL